MRLERRQHEWKGKNEKESLGEMWVRETWFGFETVILTVTQPWINFLKSLFRFVK